MVVLCMETATTGIYTVSIHDALPIFGGIVEVSTTQIDAGTKLSIYVGGAGKNPGENIGRSGPSGGWNGGGGDAVTGVNTESPLRGH